ncbi:MAG: hypothetical protein ACR2NZ_19175 [Rubripirellula sp.]
MSNLNPYRPGTEIDPELSISDPTTSDTLPRVYYAWIGLIVGVVITFVLSEILITLVMMTPLRELAQLTGDFDGLIVVILPIFVTPLSFFVALVQGMSRGSKPGRIAALGLSVIASACAFLYLTNTEPNLAQCVAIISTISLSLVASVFLLDSYLRRITRKRAEVRSSAQTRTERPSAILMLSISGMVVIVALAVRLSTDYETLMFAFAAVYLAGFACALMCAFYQLAVYGRNPVAWVGVAIALLSPIVFFV